MSGDDANNLASLVEGEKALFTCCIITTVANKVVSPFHDRMPAVHAADDYAKWLDDDSELKERHALLKPYPAELMKVVVANPLVNNVRNEGPQLLNLAA